MKCDCEKVFSLILSTNRSPMKTIMLVVDDETCKEYEELCPHSKQEIKQEISLLLKKAARDARAAKLHQLIRDINNGDDTTIMQSEMLVKLLPID